MMDLSPENGTGGPSSGNVQDIVEQTEKNDGPAVKNTPRYIISQKSQKSQNQRGKRKSTRQGYYGPPQCEVGTLFASREECSVAGVHHPNRAGISGSTSRSLKDAEIGAFSIVLSGGYEDDIDNGYIIYYSGAGGLSDQSGNQIEDQSKNLPFNRALRMNIQTRKPVRVVRGFKLKRSSKWAPKVGYRYDGLYRVVKFKMVKGKAGYQVCLFKLERLPNQRPLEDLPVEPN